MTTHSLVQWLPLSWWWAQHQSKKKSCDLHWHSEWNKYQVPSMWGRQIESLYLCSFGVYQAYNSIDYFLLKMKWERGEFCWRRNESRDTFHRLTLWLVLLVVCCVLFCSCLGVCCFVLLFFTYKTFSQLTLGSTYDLKLSGTRTATIVMMSAAVDQKKRVCIKKFVQKLT